MCGLVDMLSSILNHTAEGERPEQYVVAGGHGWSRFFFYANELSLFPLSQGMAMEHDPFGESAWFRVGKLKL